MIISRTPFRISLLGGGSDLRHTYHVRSGSVVALAINRYMYVTVKSGSTTPFACLYEDRDRQPRGRSRAQNPFEKPCAWSA